MQTFFESLQKDSEETKAEQWQLDVTKASLADLSEFSDNAQLWTEW